MGGPTTTGSISTHVPVTGGGRTDPRAKADPSRIGLADRVTTAPSAPARAGLLRRIGNAIANGLGRLFSARGSVARGADVDVETRQLELQQSLHEVKDALLAPKATCDTIREALVCAGAAAQKMKPTDGACGELIHHTLLQIFASASPEQLGRIATRLCSPALAELQSELGHFDHAQQVFMGLEVALHAGVTRTVETNVRKQIGTAMDVLMAGGPATRVTDHLRLAFAAAVPLLKPRSLEAGTETNVEVRKTILNELGTLPDNEARRMLLMHLPRIELRDLDATAENSHEPIAQAIQSEIRLRPDRLSGGLQFRGQQFERHGTQEVLDRRAFLQDLSHVTRELATVHEHVRNFGSKTNSPPELNEVKRSVAATAQAVISSGRLDLNDLTAIEIRELTLAFSALGAAEAGNALLANVQREMLVQCCANLARSLEKLGNELIAGTAPENVLKRLTEATEAGRTLENTRSALGQTADKLRKWSSEKDLMAQWVVGLSEAERIALRAALSRPHFEPLLDDLAQAEGAAHTGREMGLVKQLREMGNLLSSLRESIEEELDIPRAQETAPPSEPMRRALSKLYGVELSRKRAKLNAGRFNPEQTEVVAKTLQRALSKDELKPAQVGTHMVTDLFRVDARRRVPQVWIVDATGASKPLIDPENWPSDLDDPDYSQRDARIAEGYERLIAFCGGDEQQARALVAHFNQQIVAGLDSACVREDSPLRLDDGTAGCPLENDRGGGHLAVDVTLSVGENGRTQLDVSYRTEGRNSLAPAQGGTPVFLSADSGVQMDFRAELDKSGALTLLNTPSYRFSLKRDEFQKYYAQPDVAFLREAPEAHAGLQDALIYARPLGEDYQITALRAADAFQRKPTVYNAASVMAECDRGGEKAAGLVSPEVRRKVDAELENRRQGVVAAFDGAVHAAELILVHSAKYSRVAHDDAKEFLSEVNRLHDMPAHRVQEEAENLHHLYLEQRPGVHLRGDRRTLAIDRQFAADTAQHLATQREAAAQPVFAPDLFGTLGDTVIERLETEVLPGMIDAVKRGEL